MYKTTSQSYNKNTTKRTAVKSEPCEICGHRVIFSNGKIFNMDDVENERVKLRARKIPYRKLMGMLATNAITPRLKPHSCDPNNKIIKTKDLPFKIYG